MYLRMLTSFTLSLSLSLSFIHIHTCTDIEVSIVHVTRRARGAGACERQISVSVDGHRHEQCPYVRHHLLFVLFSQMLSMEIECEDIQYDQKLLRNGRDRERKINVLMSRRARE